MNKSTINRDNYTLSPGAQEELILSRINHPLLQQHTGPTIASHILAYRRTIELAEWLFKADLPILAISNKGKSLATVTTTNPDDIDYASRLISTPRSHYFTNAFPDVFIHPFVELITTKLDALECRSMELGRVLADGKVVAEQLNQAIAEYQREASAPSIQKQVAVWRAMQSDHYATAKRFIQSCEPAGYPRVLVVRVDLSLKEPYQKTSSIFTFHQAVHALWKNHRHKPNIFQHCLGWVWSIEYAEECNYHAHCVFIFDGNKVQNDCYYADQIGQYWIKTITHGKGSYYNCNRDKAKYQYCGLGRIDLRSSQKRRYLLERVLPYLAKEDTQIAAAIALDGAAMGLTAQNIRTFGCSAQLKHKLIR
ncbi:YagK/YfjJ domain-containing protein [Aquitalea aquatilis]|uniref:YagK/YfjJ domain-containing protein n=1 Tax=Aquitalea aquatilis TaxID=1537400 RepID=UPI0010BD4A75|nr:inovirus-type Gp2 protein [Aquitalea aquatilis]